MATLQLCRQIDLRFENIILQYHVVYHILPLDYLLEVSITKETTQKCSSHTINCAIGCRV